MSDISFAREWMFALIPLVPAALGAWWIGVRRAARRGQSLSRAASARPPYAAAILFALAAVAAIVAGAQPRWGTRESKIPRTGADLVVVMDISRSMDAQDVAPDRLQAAKTTVQSILTRLGGDRVGLVVFAGDARIRFPLTTDLSAARQVLESLQTGVVFVDGGTNAGLGLEQAVALLSENKQTGQVILLLTDGEDLGGDPAASALAVQQSGASLLIAGVGTAGGATIPVVDPRSGSVSSKLGPDGVPLISRLNEPFLRTLASAAGGRYLGSDLSVVPGAVDGRLRALQRSQIDSRPTILPVERYQYFAIAALVLLVLGSLAERFARFPLRSAAAFAVLALLLGGCATSDYDANEAGRAALKDGDTEQAIDRFLEVQVSRPDDPEVALNLAAAYAAAGRNEEAILAARRALDSNRPETRARAFASIGHHQFAAGRLPESLDAFRRALLESGGDDASRHDYEVVLRLLFPDVDDPDDGTPPGDATPPPDSSTPGAGASQQPGGTPQPGTGTPPAGSPSPGGPPGAGTPGTPTPGPGSSSAQSREQIDRQLGDIDQQVTRLLEDAGETPSPSQALEILRLLAERARIASIRDSLNGGGGPKDY
ncbi:MAG: VWA domain-containing protein [bacterium]